MTWRLRPLATLAALVTCAAAGLLAVAATPASAAPVICDQYGTASVQGGRYTVQNNRWGASTTQCIDVSNAGFTVTRADHNNATNGPPASYPSIYAGCHYGACTVNSGLPARVSALNNPRATFNLTTPNSGEWDAAFDLWFDPNPNPAGQNYGAELMIWTNHRGRPQPIGSRIATVSLEGGTWDVWFGNIGWNVISYVRTTPTNTFANFGLKSFVNDSVGRGKIDTAWFMTSVQAGFEPWIGGTGLAVNQFDFNVNGDAAGGGGGGGGVSVLRGVAANRCVDVAGWGRNDGTPVQLYDCFPNNGNQQWRRVGNTFVSVDSGKCLDVAGGRTGNGTEVRLWTCLNNGAQQWVVNGDGSVVNPNSGKCLDAVERGTANGTRIQIWDCGNPLGGNQQWRLG
ncbi:GH12 family glycosyl hydrolase domain-containing protein [Micromonospora sp. 067-2]|uniref:GH12 family glycosyl hydrolase domain-containing protein n=1 Tax=Micromonospora sp. 067-2 TaxID=2789270 RepID=UPI003978E2E8